MVFCRSSDYHSFSNNINCICCLCRTKMLFKSRGLRLQIKFICFWYCLQVAITMSFQTHFFLLVPFSGLVQKLLSLVSNQIHIAFDVGVVQWYCSKVVVMAVCRQNPSHLHLTNKNQPSYRDGLLQSALSFESSSLSSFPSPSSSSSSMSMSLHVHFTCIRARTCRRWMRERERT